MSNTENVRLKIKDCNSLLWSVESNSVKVKA